MENTKNYVLSKKQHPKRHIEHNSSLFVFDKEQHDFASMRKIETTEVGKNHAATECNEVSHKLDSSKCYWVQIVGDLQEHSTVDVKWWKNEHQRESDLLKQTEKKSECRKDRSEVRIHAISEDVTFTVVEVPCDECS